VTPLQLWRTFPAIDRMVPRASMAENHQALPMARVSSISITTRDGFGDGVRS